MLPKNVINWFQIPCNDLGRAAKFYSTILGHEVSVRDFGGTKMGFFPMSGDKGDVGGALIPSMNGAAPSATGTCVFLACDDIDAVLGRVEAAGGKLHTPKTEIGAGMGSFAFLIDTEGNQVGLHSR